MNDVVMEWKTPVVLHMDFGAFHLTDEMMKRLRKRGCKWVSSCAQGAPGVWFLPSDLEGGGHDIRKDPDLVGVVQELTVDYEAQAAKLDHWRDRAALQKQMLANLRVVEVRVAIEIEDRDGLERVRVTGGPW